MADVPSDPGVLAGNYIPNLTAATSDARAMRAIAQQLYSEDQVVAQLAASGLRFFPQDQVNALVRNLIHETGPSDVLARVICAPTLWEYRTQFVSDNIRFLDSRGLKYRAAAIEALLNLVHYANEGLSAATMVAADGAILNAAPAVLASGDQEAKRQLALYLAGMKGPQAHDWLWKIALAGGTAAEQARNALTWKPQRGDLPRLAAMLLDPGDTDPTGRDLSDLPNAISHAYGENSIPWLEKAVNGSPYVWVRTQAAEELARRNDPVGFRFLLDAIEDQRSYERELIQFLKDAFPSDLKRKADDTEVEEFLKERLKPRQ